jgi:hypothetical protein
MARIIPDGWRELANSDAAPGAAGAELPPSAQRHHETLALMAGGLSDDFTVYHAVHWTTIERGFAVIDNIDFVVVNRLGDLLLIEQKTGFLEESGDGLMRRERGRLRNVSVQMARTAAGLRDKLARRPGAEAVKVDALLYCPDFSVRRLETAGVPAERIVDAGRRDTLLAVIREILSVKVDGGRAAGAGSVGAVPGASGGRSGSTAGGTAVGTLRSASAWQQVDRFFRDVIELETDVSALVGRAQAMVTRVSGGLAHWARQLDFSPYRLHVEGTAGSGKTQLALAEFRGAIDRGLRPLYVCYNRPLADHFAEVAPAGGEVCTFHTLCQRLVRDAGKTVDIAAPDGFERLEKAAAGVQIDDRWRFDTVVVDEGQDFSPAWRDQMLRHARDDARLIWLEDPMQSLYARERSRLPGWVTLHARANYRSPREVVRLLRAILPADVQIEAAGPLAGAELEIFDYADTAQMLAATKEAIRSCLGTGFRRHDIAVVSFRGREQSALLSLDAIGPHPVRRFTGRYDLLAQPVYTGGELLVESVYRFKGQAAPAVVFSEVDFESMDERSVRKLFVGATRATMKLSIVASTRAARILRAALARVPQA